MNNSQNCIYLSCFKQNMLENEANIIMRPPPFIMWALFNLFESHIFFMKGHRFFMSINFVLQSLYYRSYRLFMISVTDSLWSKYNCMMIVQFESPVNKKPSKQHLSQVLSLNSGLCHLRQIINSSLLLWLSNIILGKLNVFIHHTICLGQRFTLRHIMYDSVFRTLPRLNILLRTLSKIL